MGLEQALDSILSSGHGPRIVEQPAVVLSGEHDSEKLEAELPGIGPGG